MAEPINLPFGLWTWVVRRKHKCPHGRAHWRHLAPMCPSIANTIEQSVCGGDAALYQIALIICSFC